MLIQNNYDLILLGNIIIDDVYSIPSWGFEGTSNIFDKYSQNIGGIGNLIKEFNMINNNKLSLFVESIIGNDLNGNLIINF